MRSYKKKKVAGNDIMELDLGLGGAKNTRKKYIWRRKILKRL